MTTTLHTETFSYLPTMSDEEVGHQIRYILDNGWIPGIEYTHEPDPANSFWSFWELPLFDAQTPADVQEQLEACRKAHPESYIKLTGYDNERQGQVLSFVVHRP